MLSCKQLFVEEIQEVQYSINSVRKITYDVIENLETKKKLLQKQISMTSTEVEGSTQLKNNLLEVNLDIENIQNEQDKIVQELEQEKQMLKKRLSTIEKLDLLTNILTYKIFDEQYDFRKQMDELCIQRDKLVTGSELPSTKIAFGMAEIDKKMNNLRNLHEESMTNLEGQRSELRKEAALKIQHMDGAMESLKTHHFTILNELETTKLTSTPSQISEINKRIGELNRLYKQDIESINKLQLEGWKDYSNEEKLSALLEARGVKISPSGYFLTASGNRLTQSEASQCGLLEGIDFGSRTDLRHKENETTDWSNSTSCTSSTVTMEECMDSEDVQYLKTVFAKPLTLALGEICAKQPRDPIHYLGHWLIKYRYNQEICITKKLEIQELLNERERIEKEKLHAMFEDEAQAAILKMIKGAENEAICKALERIAQETLQLEDEEESLDSEAQDVLGVYNGPKVGHVS
ncbi:hypothetical protein FQA39_LY07241 [Lamprigera yunnana]|nr:hypothetical protein FQA39_LY07241 [Lamprigera yunnana]